VSRFTRQLALKKYDVKIQVIPNGVDLETLKPSRIQLNEPPRIVFAGRFMAQKNPLQLVQTLNEVKKLDWQCVMIGDGPLMQDVRRTIAELDLGDRFQLPGWIDPQDVLNWFDKSDILFMPSRSEGLPVIGVQALAKGLEGKEPTARMVASLVRPWSNRIARMNRNINQLHQIQSICR
jgi:glycosyltransferase involved in cell wall biosynthesis